METCHTTTAAAPYRINLHPVFAEGTFRGHPDLLTRFTRHAADHMIGRYERAWQILLAYEGALRWPLLSGPGFHAATHPGADTIFSDTMAGLEDSLYNSDCVYVNPAERVFAVSDPPGITDSARRLFERLDGILGMEDDVEGLVNRLNHEMPAGESTAFCLLRILPGDPGTVAAMVAGDALLFHGNARQRTVRAIPARAPFLGTPYAVFQARKIPLAPDDFFILASDGILSLKGNDPDRRLEDLLRDHLDGDEELFVLRAMEACNGHFVQEVLGRTVPRFGGCDNVSLVFVRPDGLRTDHRRKSFILGGERHLSRPA